MGTENNIYMPTGWHGVECTRDGMGWRRPVKGRMTDLHPRRRRHTSGVKQTAYLIVLENGERHYHACNTLVAAAWKSGYEEGDYIVHADDDLHNLDADNLRIVGKDDYTANRNKRSVNTVSLKDRIKKLETVHEETAATLALFKDNDWRLVHKHVERYLVGCLMDFCIRSLHLSPSTAHMQVPEVVARLYECLDRGYCIYNYERWCKEMLHNYKKTGTLGIKSEPPSKNIRQMVAKQDIEKLCEHFNTNQYNSLCSMNS